MALSRQQSNVDQNHISNPFGLSYIIFYILLSLSMGTGLLAVHIFVTSHPERLILEGIFIAISIMIAGTQLVIQYALFSRFWSPLRHFINDLRTRYDRFESIKGNGAQSALQETHQQMLSASSNLNDQYPGEVKQLYDIFSRQMRLLENYAKEATAQSNLIVMGQMCAQVAHDMRAPLCVLRVFLENVPVEESEVKLVAFKEVANRSCARLSQMADELLNYKKATQLERKPIDLGSLIRSMCDELRRAVNDEKIDIRYDGLPSVDYYGDAEKLSRVVQNLLSNGIQAISSPDGGHVHVALCQDGERIIIDVADSGTGIPEENLHKLFLPTFSTKGKNGNGLGLAYCQSVVEGHGGIIEAMNRQDAGALFRITLPAIVAH
ncbi:MAG: hypothetical protein A3H42_00925 [Deltaproteobacteria bacterium RIFCSPLOWO2_02_FULL_46_8]|nr:MAG: hypothetical protein A3H42_00925 [Deltaproteobacteria bacterium RIFCSPLOWO2_02_FULL_46_8]